MATHSTHLKKYAAIAVQGKTQIRKILKNIDIVISIESKIAK
jgi:hypothetical protein